VPELLLTKLNCTDAPSEDCPEPTSPQEASLAPLKLKLYVAGGDVCVGFGVVGLGLGAAELVAGAGACVVGCAAGCVVGCTVGRRLDGAEGRWLVGAAVGDGWVVGD